MHLQLILFVIKLVEQVHLKLLSHPPQQLILLLEIRLKLSILLELQMFSEHPMLQEVLKLYQWLQLELQVAIHLLQFY